MNMKVFLIIICTVLFLKTYTKESNQQTVFQNVASPNLTGNWKEIVFGPDRQFLVLNTIQLIQNGDVIKGRLISIQNEKGIISKSSDYDIVGIKKGLNVALFFKGQNDYTATANLTINHQGMQGSWFDTINKKGSLKLFKIQNLLPNELKKSL